MRKFSNFKTKLSMRENYKFKKWKTSLRIKNNNCKNLKIKRRVMKTVMQNRMIKIKPIEVKQRKKLKKKT